MNMNNVDVDMNIIKPKRGRRSKKDIAAANELSKAIANTNVIISNSVEVTSNTGPTTIVPTTIAPNDLLQPSKKVKAVKVVKAHKVSKTTKDDITENIKTNIDLNNSVEISDEISNEISSLSNNIANNDDNENNENNENNDDIVEPDLTDENNIIKPPAKKRGRKPKGGKIVQQKINMNGQKEIKPNIILHLKCSIKDLQNHSENDSSYNNANIESFHFNASKNELSYEIISNPNHHYSADISLYDSHNNNSIQHNVADTNSGANSGAYSDNDDNYETKGIWRKLKILEHDLHINNISDKKSACFWCSYDFDNPPIYIPKYYIKDSYHVYGCFCSPECATAHLMDENIDSSVKFERYHLINHIYSKIYEYKKNIKPAPNPYYMLEKYYGNLTIQEYRTLLRSERLFLIVDKPLTRILPEFHEDNDEFIINNKIIPSNNYQVKKKLQKKSQTKNNILNEKFGIAST